MHIVNRRNGYRQMKRNVLIFLSGMFIAVTLLVCCRQTVRVPPADMPFTCDVMLRHTPIKNQGNSEYCWVYAMLATIESEHIMQGDSINLSSAYVIRMMLRDEAVKYYFSKGKGNIVMRGMCSMLPALLEKHGIEAFDAFEDNNGLNCRVLCRKLMREADLNIAIRSGLQHLNDRIDKILDDNMGYLPRTVFMLGAEYTPVEFAHSVCLPNEYLAFTSFTHHPFYRKFVLEVPDNRLNDAFMNLPIDSLMHTIEQSLHRGHPVCWEGDISEKGFSFDRGIAVLPNKSRQVTQQIRQRAFETLQTTDDHAMELVGIAHDKTGRKYFIAKNSWGTNNPYGGLIYLSYNYVKLKTIAVFLSKNAFDRRKNYILSLKNTKKN